MLRLLRMKNFRTCHDTAIAFAPVTLLVGKNNTGKSNIGKSLRFLSACAQAEDLDSAALQAGMAPSEVVSRYDADAPIELHVEGEFPAGKEQVAFTYDLVMQSRDPGRELTHILTITEERAKIAWGPRSSVLLERSSARAKTSLGAHKDAFELEPWQSALYSSRLPSGPAAEFIRYLRSWRMYSVPGLPRPKPQKAQYDAYLADTRDNLNSVLFTLKNEDERTFDTLLGLVQEIEPSLHTLNFIQPGPEGVWMEVEDSEGHHYGPESLSEGTLRYMALCYIALHPEVRTHRDVRAPALAFIEEPDAGIYAGQLRRMLEVLRVGSEKQQIILTTHNPYLTDLFEANLDQVRLVSRGQCRLRDSTTVTELDAEQMRSLLAKMPLGEALYRGLLQ